ncbi:MAG: VanZ family protein [Lachnospiraceae bacterium]|nr:VanZ family protein [Lachnospiraceae bacterium]
MEKMNKLKKIVVSSIATIFLVLLYSLIFTFSDQDGEASGGLSRKVSEMCVEIWNTIAGKNWSESIIESWALYFEHPVRKIAHFCEYAMMAFLLFFIWYPWIGLYGKGIVEKPLNVRRWKRIPLLAKIIIPWIFVSAAFDEIHQLFVPERWGNFADVLLDTAGGCFGLICCIYGDKILNHIHMRRKRK